MMDNFISAASYIYCKDKYGEICLLCGKRSGNDPRFNGGKYNVPTGMREYSDKNIAETARREVYEETGIDIPINKFILIGSEEWGSGKIGANFKVFLDGVTDNYEIGNGDFENDKFQWMPLNDINSVEWMYKQNNSANKIYKTMNENQLTQIIGESISKHLIMEYDNDKSIYEAISEINIAKNYLKEYINENPESKYDLAIVLRKIINAINLLM